MQSGASIVISKPGIHNYILGITFENKIYQHIYNYKIILMNVNDICKSKIYICKLASSKIIYNENI